MFPTCIQKLDLTDENQVEDSCILLMSWIWDCIVDNNFCCSSIMFCCSSSWRHCSSILCCCSCIIYCWCFIAWCCSCSLVLVLFNSTFVESSSLWSCETTEMCTEVFQKKSHHRASWRRSLQHCPGHKQYPSRSIFQPLQEKDHHLLVKWGPILQPSMLGTYPIITYMEVLWVN